MANTVRRTDIRRQRRVCARLSIFYRTLTLLQTAGILAMIIVAYRQEADPDFSVWTSLLVDSLSMILVFGSSWLQDRIRPRWFREEDRLDGMIDARD